MALTEAQKLTICTILDVSIVDLNWQLGWWAPYITATTETQIIAELARWTTYGNKFVRLSATESNYGVNTNSDDVKGDIMNNLSVLLGWNPSQFGGGRRLQRS